MTRKLAIDWQATGRDAALGGLASTAGTAAGLYGGSLLLRRFSPAAAKLLHNAGNESWMFLNPMRSLNLLKRLPRAGLIAGRQMALVDNLSRAAPLQLSKMTPTTLSSLGDPRQAMRHTRQAQQYFRDYGETPGDTLEKGIGVANGVLNLGIGAGIGAAPHLMPSMPGTAMNKQSAASITPELIRQEANRQLQLDTAKKILGMTGVGFGAGFGLRSLVGLSSLMKRNLSGPPKPSLMSSAAIPIPVQDPYVEGGERKEKKANDVFSNLGNYFSELLKGRKATTPTGIPWAVPAAMAAAPVGMYAGARAADFIADKLRASELDAELKSEQEQFEAALRGQQGTKLAAALDELEAELEKKGSFDNALGAMLGLYAGYAGLSGLSAGSAVYDATKKTQTAHVLQEALKQREAANNAKRPVPIMLADPGDQEEQLA